MPHISVVIPVYQAEAVLPVLHARLTVALQTLTPDFEILLVDDGSDDGSWRVMEDLAGRDPRVKSVRLSRNFGQHHAITAGLDLCDGDWVVIMDCDLQDRPESILSLYTAATGGYDVVLARRQRRLDAAWKRASSWLFYKVLGYLTDIDWDQRIGVFRLMSRTAVVQMRQMREQMRFTVGLTEWMGFPTTGVDVTHGQREEGTTTYTLRKLLRFGGSAIIAYSEKPLRLAIQLGFVISLAAFALGGFVIARYLTYGKSIMGWSSLMVVVLFMGGLHLIMLGVIGVYLGKVFDETKGRPLYIISRRINV